MKQYPGRVLQDVQNTSFVSFLDLARWCAASIVFLGHLRDPLFLGYGDVIASDRNPAIQIWFFVTGWYGEAVIVFFVLSGFLVGGLASARYSVGEFSLVDYAVDRVTRLYVPLLPALLLTALLDFAATHWFSDIGFYTHLHPMIHQKVNAAPYLTNMNLSTFISNALMLQTIVAPSFGSNDPLWTISLEFWFYVVFGLALGSLMADRGCRIIGLGAVVILLMLLGAEFPFYMGLWLCGVGTAFIPWRRAERPLIAAIIFLGLLILTRAGQAYFKQGAYGVFLRNYVVAISFAWLLMSMRSVHLMIFERLKHFNRFMADFSYSLYLIHFPLMLFLLVALHATGRFDTIARGYLPTSGEGLLVYAIVIVLTYLNAWLFSQATERQTWKVRRRLKRAMTTRVETLVESLRG